MILTKKEFREISDLCSIVAANTGIKNLELIKSVFDSIETQEKKVKVTEGE